MSQAMFFEPSARLQKYLGKELISDPNLAIIEFVKNAYDAGAGHVRIVFELNRAPTRLIISDDGIGMDEESFRENWLRPGFSRKSPDYKGARTPRTGNAAARRRLSERDPAGEKGLGRLAAGRLGQVLRIWTRPSKRAAWLHVHINWSDFDDMNRALNQVPITHTFTEQLPDGLSDHAFEVGTIVEISDLTQSWVGKMRGRPSPGRARTRLGRLKQDLEFLVRPLEGGNASFEVSLISDSFVDANDVGVISPSNAGESAEYSYDFIVGVDEADYVTVQRTLRRRPEVAERLGKPVEEKLPTVTVTRAVALEQDRSETLYCAPFAGTFYYTPPPAAKRAKEVDAVGAGVLLYRDNILVEPYGLPGDDWVGVEARKASRQGHAAIQPATFTGAIRISRKNNPDLEDMSNRLGLLDNDASADLFSHVRAEFAAFEHIIYEEVVRPRWRSLEQVASLEARKAGSLAATRLRAIAHSLGQPLQAIGFELIRLERFAKKHDLSEDAARELGLIRERIELHIERMASTTRKFADFEVPEFEPVIPADLIQEAVRAIDRLAVAEGVDISIGAISTESVVVPTPLVLSALEELLTNAIEAERPEGRPPAVSISTEDGPQFVEIRVEDNGIGFSGVKAGASLNEIPSTKGRPSEGLPTVLNAVISSNGTVDIERSDAEGSVLVVRLPRGLKTPPS